MSRLGSRRPVRTLRQRNGRVTPYSTQRKSREKNGPDFLPDYNPTTDQLEVLADVVSKTWHLHHCSPLWGLVTSTSQLRSYSQQLIAHLSANGFSGDGPRAPAQLTARVAALPRFGLDSSEALWITITKRAVQKGKPLVEALLCKPTEQGAPAAGFTSLPLLLLRGPTPLFRQLLVWLQTTFDCHTSPASLVPEDLSLLVAQYATAEKAGRGLGTVEMVYSLPPAVKGAGLSTVTLQLPFESAVTVWEATSSTQDRRKAFTQTLCEHIHRHFGIKLSSMTLARISTPVLHAEGTGRIKFASVFCVLPVLSVLQPRTS